MKEFAPCRPEEVSTIIIIIKWKCEIVLVDKRANATIHIIRQHNYAKGFDCAKLVFVFFFVTCFLACHHFKPEASYFFVRSFGPLFDSPIL